jgi:hypothetical protein
VPFQLNVDEGSTAVLAPGLGPSNAHIHPLTDHGALELGEHAHHPKHRLAGRRRRVEKVDAQAVQLSEEAAEVLQRTAKTVDDQAITTSSRRRAASLCMASKQGR